jgi:hypothetical protein
VCIIVEVMFLAYEYIQFKKEGRDYLDDYWNYFEIFGILFYFIASAMDITNTKTSDVCRILFVVSLLFSLFKILYLIRVF